MLRSSYISVVSRRAAFSMLERVASEKMEVKYAARSAQATARNLNFLHSSTLTNSPRFEITTCWTDAAKPRNFVTQSRVYGWLARRAGYILQLQTTSTAALLCQQRLLLRTHTYQLRHSLTHSGSGPGPCASTLLFLAPFARSLSVVRHDTPRF